MIKVRLLGKTDCDPLELASHAAQVCYQAEAPKMGKKIDVQNRLFETGHHTTLQHFSFTFNIEGVSVGDVTFGLHLVSPFYNSDQRSGRFCAKMFLEPDFSGIENYIKILWPDVEEETRARIMDFVRKGVAVYHANIEKTTQIAREFIKNERPFASEKYLEQNAPKIAQEQLRMFIPVIFPTGLDMTLNLTSLVALYESAWTPAMKNIANKMVELVKEAHPEISFMFKPERASTREWGAPFDEKKEGEIKLKPECQLVAVQGEEKFIIPDLSMTHPTDKLHFFPEMMDNSIGEIHTAVEISIATMGQDQRHRTIRRGMPKLTGNFYLPPVLLAGGLSEEALELMKNWKELHAKIPHTLATVIAPYGAMVNYEKVGSFNAIAHEQGKRLCWCAQEEIYHIGRLLRKSLEQKLGSNSQLLKMLEPPCFRDGKCIEGVRYCGRDMKKRLSGDYFPERKI